MIFYASNLLNWYLNKVLSTTAQENVQSGESANIRLYVLCIFFRHMTHFIFLFHRKNIFLKFCRELSFIIWNSSEIISQNFILWKYDYISNVVQMNMCEINHSLNLLFSWMWVSFIKYYKKWYANMNIIINISKYIINSMRHTRRF